MHALNNRFTQPGPPSNGEPQLLPEAPATQAYTPNSIQDLQAANPATGIVLIQAPEPSLQGSADLNFALKLPPGRQGMQPNLSIDYSSGSGNGWLGLDWSIYQPTIDIDTRWGVPRFSAGQETETYLLESEQLSPVAHRAEPQPREADKQFHPRVEGDFARIIRHGNHPNNYWWSVTYTDGTVGYYGGDPASNAPNEAAVLRDPKGNIVRWALTEVRDLNDNFMRYYWETAEDPGLSGSSEMGKQLYLARIAYTGFGSEEGPFSIHFLRDRQLNETLRVDKSIDARLGFKMVTADLLRRIEVKRNDAILRTYDLEYAVGAFNKTLLQNISEFDKEGKLFYEHQFNYYDDVRQGGNYQPFTNAQNWNVPKDQVGVNFVNPIPIFPGDASLLGGSSSNSINGGSAATVGPLGSLASKDYTVGGNFSIGKSDANGLLALVDINGDGLPDKIFQQNNQLFYRPNLGAEQAFGEKYAISGIKEFSVTKTNFSSFGFEANVTPVFVGYENTSERSTTEVYFSDFNGDDLIDIAARGRVYFNHLDENGHPAFTTNSGDTPSPIGAGAPLDNTLIEIDPNEQEMLIDQNPLHDVVRSWEAPCDGVVFVEGPIMLLQDDSQDATDYGRQDGVRVAIQHRGNELWATTIAGDDFTAKTPVGVGNINVQQGDRIYFRVQSVFDGAYDQVLWDPVITYRNQPAGKEDANEKPDFHYRASDDFLLASCQSTSVPMSGTIRILGEFQKPITSDDLVVEILRLRGGQAFALRVDSFPWDSIVNQPIELEEVPIQLGDEVVFRVSATTNIDWTAIQWMPRMYYTSATDGSLVFDPDGKPMFDFCPAVDYRMFTQTWNKSPLWIAPDSADFRISLPAGLQNLGVLNNGTVTLSAKGRHRLYNKVSFRVTNGGFPALAPMEITAADGDSLYFEYHITGSDLGRAWQNKARGREIRLVEVGQTDTVVLETGLYATRAESELIFGPQYRGWGQFVYNGNRERALSPIIEGDLELPEIMIDTSELDNIDDPDDLGDVGDPTKAKFVVMYSDPKTASWRGYDELTYLMSDRVSSSRMGVDDISLLPPPDNGGTGASAPNLLSKARIHAVAGGLSAGPGSLGASQAWNETCNLLDVEDFNGDRYPDVITPTKIQYSNATGGLSSFAINHTLGAHIAKSEATGVTLGGAFVNSSPSNAGASAGKGSRKRSSRTKARVNNSGKKSQSATRSAESSAGLSGSFTDDNDWTEHSWLDINGDGLPDKLFRNGNVALNYGYHFGPAEPWDFVEIRAGKSTDYGAGVGINISNNSIAGGVAMSRTDNYSTYGFQDLNGDGLLDKMRYADPNLYVSLNTGVGFAAEIRWPGAETLDQGDATAESANAAFTICIPIFFVRFCINPSGSVGQGVSRVLTQIEDIDGDGYPDHLRSDEDGELSVKRSTIGRTNLLKEVKRPLGGSFTVDYTMAGNTYGLPYGQWVMSKVEIRDGLPGDGADVIALAYEYEEGKYDRHEREFYGFGKVRENHLDSENNNALYRTKVWEYDVSNYYRKGLLLGEYLLDAEGRKYTETRHTYALKQPTTGNDLPASFGNSEDGSAFPAKVETRELFYEGADSPALQTRMTYTYDRWGNTISITDFGNGQADDQLTTDIAYHEFPDLYLKNVPASVKVYGNQSLLRHKETVVDEQGDIIQIRRFTEDGPAAETDLEYDDYGNLIRLTRPPNHRGERMFYAYTYDEEVHTYLLQTEDAYGYTSSREYDYSNGQLLGSTDINGQRTVYKTDTRGRIISVTGPYELEAGKDFTIDFEYHPEATVPYAKTRHYDPEHDDYIETYQFIDGLERSVQTKKTVAIHQGPGQEDRMQLMVSGADEYDAFGRVVINYYPTLENTGQGANLNNNIDAVAPTRTEYDVLDRPLSIQLPDGATNHFTYSIAADNQGQTAFLTSRTDALNHIQDTYTDVRGRIQALSEEGPTGSIWTNFRYNALSQITAGVDAAGNETNYTYDRLGRRSSLSQPDGGTTSFTFDLADNLIAKVTENIRQRIPNDGAVRYTYEFERLVQIDYPKNFQNRVQLHYGAPDAGHYRTGRIWLREDASGGEEYFYGPLGEIVKSIRTLLINEANVVTYVMESEYDTWGRLQRLVYPDGEEVNYHYNRAGKLRSVDSEKWTRPYQIVNQIGYDKFEEKVYVEYGNGSSTTYNYEAARRRLQQIQFNNRAGTIADTRYAYDALDNVLTHEQTGEAGTGRVDLAYDEVYRLSRASGSWQGEGPEEKYELSLAYDQLHNITHKTRTVLRDTTVVDASSFDWAYRYDGAQPHVPSAIGSRNVQADANGNLLGYQDEDGEDGFRQLLWDEENRLMGVSNDGYISQYTYDAQSERAIQSHGGIRGVFTDGAPAGLINHRDNYKAYVSAYMTAEKEQFTKHYFVEGERVLSKVGTGKFNNKYWFGRGITAGGLNYVSRIQQLRQTVWNYYGQLGVPPGPPTLPGFYAQPEYTGNSLPTDTTYSYSNPPLGWPTKPAGPPDPEGPPGPPVWFPANGLSNDNVQAGYGFEGNGVFQEVDQFFYHSDQLGSSNYVTDYNGDVRQHTEYFPFGEVFIQEDRSADEANYLYNGKELDKATGLYYYGARFYDARLSLWQSIDPLAAAYPAWSPYAYVLQNPFTYSDPDGQAPHQLFRSPDAAAKDFGRLFNPVSIRKNRELAASIYEVKRNGRYYYAYSKPAKGTIDGSDPNHAPAPAGTRTIGDIHTHGAEIARYDNNNFSDTDIDGIAADGHIGFVVTPKGYLKRYNPWAKRITLVSTDMPHDERHYGPMNPTKAERRKFTFRPQAPETPGHLKQQYRKFQLNGQGKKKKRGNNLRVTFR
jgi:RHS repeat-associated protein